AKFTVSRYGQPVLLLGGYRFNKNHSSSGPKVRWNCTRKSSSGCKASAITVENEVIMAYDHNH
ncbi:Uncharacterized protein OBRU01_26553, partial [Operophtera brumata]